MSAHQHHLWRDRRATAALEFAIVGPMLVAMLGGAADLGLSTVCRNQLAQAVGNGAQFAFKTGATVSAAAVQSMVQASSELSGVVASVTGPALFCVGGSPAILTASSAGQTCPDGTAPGTYLSISAHYTYPQLMPLSSTFLNTALQQTATVRLQ
jgi:Flp pilus assembly protein TadG